MVDNVFPEEHGGEGQLSFRFPGKIQVAVAVHVSHWERGQTAVGVVPGHLGDQGDAKAGIDEFMDSVGVVAFHDDFGENPAFPQ